MRDLLFKNLITSDKRKHILAQHEASRDQGIYRESSRRLIYSLEEIKFFPRVLNQPEYFVYNISDHKKGQVHIIYRVKGQVVLEVKDKLFLFKFRHSYQVNLASNQK